MKHAIIKATAITLAISFSTSLVADTASKVNSWFSNMNYSTVTNPGVYEGQSARYATLGGVSTRAPITQPFNFVNVQTPKFSAGCGGIDFYAGGFSAIDADQFIDNLRAIGQNAQSLAFMLAIQVVSPQLSGVMEDIQTFADKYLNLNMDSCEAATELVGGTMDYFGAKEGNCTVKRMQDFGEDWTTANYACTTGGKIKSTESSGGEPNKVDFIKGNLAWYVLMQDPFFSSDTQFAEVILNLTGTVIIADSGGADDAPSDVRIIQPALSGETQKERFDNIYTALLMGTNAANNLQIYRCSGTASSNPNGCTTMTGSLQTVTPNWTGLYTRIQNLVASIVAKIYSDTPLTNEEKGLIASTSIPLYRYLAATAAYFPRGADVSRLTSDYTSLIAEDILIRSLNAVIDKVEQRSSVLTGGMAEADRIKKYREDLDGVLRGLAKLRKENDFDVEQYFVMQQRIQLYEKALMSRLGNGMITSAMWGQ
jgi:conjugative transfer pilus assembly protein TraH